MIVVEPEKAVSVEMMIRNAEQKRNLENHNMLV